MADRRNRSKSKAKSGYHLYNGFSSLVINGKSGLKMEKHDTPLEYVAACLAHITCEDDDVLDFMASQFMKFAVDDVEILENNCPILFPESKRLVENLNASKFNFNKTVNIEIPFKAFSIAVPKGVMVDDIEVKGILVRKGKPNELIHKSICKIMDALYCYNDKNNTDYFEDERSYGIAQYSANSESGFEKSCYKICSHVKVNGTEESISFIFKEEYLSLALKTDCPDKLRKLIKAYGSESANEKNVDTSLLHFLQNENTKRIALKILKTVASTAIYISVDKSKMKKGLPGSIVGSAPNAKIGNDYPDRYFIESTEALRSTNTGDTKNSHYRIFHFRNLQHDKYYQGEHKDKEKGSRWTFVSDSLVNTSEDPFTLTK